MVIIKFTRSPSTVPILNQVETVDSHPIFVRSILILCAHLRLGIPSSLFPTGFHPEIPCAFLFLIGTTCPTSHILLDPVIQISGEAYRS